MIVERITIHGWRGYRETHTFRFQEGINLLAGRNEAGKSTLFEVLTRVLFDRHGSKTQEIRAMRPAGSSLAPEAEIVFTAGDRRYRAEKRFLTAPRSALYTERDGKWEPDHEGDHADLALRQILRGEATARTAARPEHRGLAQALWYLQSDGAIPDQKWSEAVREGLAGLVTVAARSPMESAVKERIEAAYREHFTEKGRVAKNSELRGLLDELPALEERLAELGEKARQVDARRKSLGELESDRAEKEAELSRAREELEEARARMAEGEEVRRQREEAERTKEEAEREAERLRRELEEFEGRRREIRGSEEEMKRLEDSLSKAEGDARAEKRDVDRHHRRWKEELEPALKEREAELDALRALERLRRLAKDRERLDRHVGKLGNTEAELETLRKERDGLAAPGEEEWRRFGEATREITLLKAKIEAIAIRVAFEWSGEERAVRTEPELEPPEEGEYLVTGPTAFSIEGVGTVRVRSEAADLAELRDRKVELDEEVRRTLGRFGAADAEDLAVRFERGRDLDRDVSALERALSEMEEAEPGAREELARVRRGIEEERRAAGDLPAEILEAGGARIRERIAAVEREKKRLIDEIEEEQKAEKAARERCEKLRADTGDSTRLQVELRAVIRHRKEANAATLESYGTLERFRASVAEAGERARKAGADLDEILADYEEKVETPRRLAELAEKRVDELDGRLRELQMEVKEALGYIEAAAEQGHYSRLADLEIEIERKRRRREVLERRAEGAKLLRNLVRDHEKERSAVLSGPLRDLVDRWLRLLTEEGYDALEIDDDLKPAGVHMARYDAELPLSSLSHGAREQVVVLLRLAIGVLVSEEERNLVVIDDRLVNADPVRMKRLGLILAEAAASCQILIATCNDTPYAGLSANLVCIPADGLREEGEPTPSPSAPGRPG